MLSRKTIAGFAAALMLLVGAASARAGSADLTAGAGPLDQISNFAAQARAAGGSAPNIPSLAAPAPLTKFSANGRWSGSWAAGGCLNDPITASCSSSCDSITMSGQVTATTLGKSTLDACYAAIVSTSSGACLNGLGIGTLTAANGNKVNIAFGGDFCIADEITSTLTIYYSKNLTYVVEGGTGPFATEKGTGNLTTSDIVVATGSPPLPVTGQINMTGIWSKN